MKKLLIIISLLSIASCSGATFGDFTQSFFGEKLTNLTEEEKFEKKMRSYNLEASIKTNKGVINIFLYPDAAPENVAHFVYLVKNNFYDGMKFHRVVASSLIQFGDNIGDGSGTDNSNFVNDEYASWLNFKSSGMLALAKIAGTDNTNSSQLFLTLAPISSFDNKYTIIGEIKTKEDLSVARLIRVDDTIYDITISGINVDDFLNNFKDQVSLWSSK